MQRRAYRVELLIANLLVLVLAAACVSLDLGASSAPAGSGSGSADGAVAAAATDAPSVGPRKTKKPKRTPQPTGADATAAPTEPPTEPPTDTPMPPGVTPDPNATPFCCRTFHLPPIGPIASLIVLEPLNPKLDYTASPNYGEANLSAGFTPDPYSVGMTAGGPVDVSYLGTSCSGFATTTPDLRINFGGGGAALLRLYFIGGTGDATMVINDPYGNFYCVDDSFGTVNPTIDFNNPAGGTYDVWIGSYAANTLISGTFYVTANSGNHP